MIMRGIKVSLCALLIGSLWAGDNRVDAWVRSLTRNKSSQLAAGYSLHPRNQADEKVLIGEIRRFLQDPHPEVRAYVASFLGEYRAADPESLSGLISLLGDQSIIVREHAVVALAQIGPPAVPLLVRQLNLKKENCPHAGETPPNNYDCRDYAYVALYEIGPAALPQMFALFRSLDNSGQAYSAALLRTLSPEQPQTFVDNLLGQDFNPVEIRSLLGSRSLPLADSFLGKFHGSDPPQQVSAAFALYLLYSYAVPEPRPSESTEFPAPDPAKHTPARPGTAPAHGRLVEPQTASGFLTLAILDTHNPLTDRERMALFLRDLSQTGERNTIGTTLARIASDTSEPWSMRAAAASALDEAGLQEFLSIDTLRQMLEDPSPWPLKTVAAGIAGRKGAAAQSLAPDLQRLATAKDADTMALAATRALSHLGEPGLKSLAELLHSGDEHLQMLAALATAESGPGGASLRQEALASPSLPVRFLAQNGAAALTTVPASLLPLSPPIAAREQVQQLLPPKSTEELAKILAGHSQVGVVEAANQLATQGPQGISILARYVSGPSPFVSSAAIAALALSGKNAAPAVPALCRALLDDRLQSGAARTLWIVGGYKPDCGNSIATVLKDGLIQDYVTADLSLRPYIASWPPPNPGAYAVPVDRGRMDILVRDLAYRSSTLAYRSPALSSPPSFSAPATLPPLSMPNPSIWTTIHLPLADTNNVYDAYSRILDALKNYPDIGLFAATGGFTLITRVEQIDPHWKPVADDYRWRADRPAVSPLMPFNYLREMLFAPPGEFRLIAFMVTSDLKPEFAGEEWDEAAASVKFNQGAKVLPENFRTIQYAGHYCHVLIYNYSKPLAQVAKLQDAGEGVGGVELQLTSAGIWDKLR
jgi:HEAT repeat protein